MKNDNGQFGRFDVVPGLQFPTGYAAALNAGPIQGGGGLFIYDHEYRGALALKFQSFGLAAFAILTTRLPGGEQGFSFLASLFGEFEIQLGYGFKLTGLGGVIGVHRGANVEALRETLAAGRLDSILFPASPSRTRPSSSMTWRRSFPPGRISTCSARWRGSPGALRR